jgi:glycosyltransferase involved in cell wall biosynthesis
VRIGIATWTRRLAGGVESYLADLVPALLDRGHEVALLHEVDEPADRAPITEMASVPHWCAASAPARALADLSAWRPDVIYAHGLDDPALETQVAAIAPAVFFAHAYRGTCVSGTKSFAALEHTTCDRRLGWQCLLHYFPHRCGGLNPVTMARLYRRESQRRDMFGQYAAVVAFSRHIQSEYVRHGVPQERTHWLPCHVPSAPGLSPVRRAVSALPSRILFVGRMEPLKGGHVLLDALPEAQKSLGRPLTVTFVGDGRSRTKWEAQARRRFPEGAATRVEFTGWAGPEERRRRLCETDLLVVPSLWPEPFGLIGLEAAACGAECRPRHSTSVGSASGYSMASMDILRRRIRRVPARWRRPSSNVCGTQALTASSPAARLRWLPDIHWRHT